MLSRFASRHSSLLVSSAHIAVPVASLRQRPQSLFTSSFSSLPSNQISSLSSIKSSLFINQSVLTKPATAYCNGLISQRFIHHNGQPVPPKDLKEVKVLEENIQHSPQKVNLVARQIRGLTVNDALVELRFSKKAVSETFMEAIARGIKKAYRQYKLTANDLVIGRVYVGKGRRFKRPLFSARGRVSMMQTTQSRVTLHLLESKVHAGLEKPKKKSNDKQQQNGDVIVSDSKTQISESDRKNAIVV